jgi:hypothetical protein
LSHHGDRHDVPAQTFYYHTLRRRHDRGSRVPKQV